MNHIIRVFDNKERSNDRYTVVIDEKTYSMSANPNDKKGINRYNGLVAEFEAIMESLAGKYDRNIGHEVELLSLPLEVRLAIGSRLNDK